MKERKKHNKMGESLWSGRAVEAPSWGSWGQIKAETPVAKGVAPGGAYHIRVNCAHRFGCITETDPCAGCLNQLEVSGDEVGVEVGVDHSLNTQTVLFGVGEVVGDVAARVDNDRAPGCFVAGARRAQSFSRRLRVIEGVVSSIYYLSCYL